MPVEDAAPPPLRVSFRIAKERLARVAEVRLEIREPQGSKSRRTAAWLFRIATNAIANRGKRAARFKTKKLDDIAEQERSNPTDLEIEHRARLFTMVDKLPADQLQVITMRFGIV